MNTRSKTLTGLWPDHDYNVTVRSGGCGETGGTNIVKTTVRTRGHGQRGLSRPRVSISVPGTDHNQDYDTYGELTAGSTATIRVFVTP